MNIHDACLYGNLDRVKELSLEESFDIEAKDNGGWTALIYASRYGHLEVVKWFHEQKEDCTTNAMDYAILLGHVEVVNFLKSKYIKIATVRTMTGEEYQIEYLNVNKDYECNYSPLYKVVKSHLNSLGIKKNFKLIDASGDISKKDGVPINNTAYLIYIN